MIDRVREPKGLEKAVAASPRRKKEHSLVCLHALKVNPIKRLHLLNRQDPNRRITRGLVLMSKMLAATIVCKAVVFIIVAIQLVFNTKIGLPQHLDKANR